MKVAYLLGSLNRGGTETLMLDVFHNADKAPFSFIGIHRKAGAYQEDFYASGAKVIQCAPKRFGFFQYMRTLRQVLLKEGVNIIHGQQPLDTIYGRLATIGTGIKLIQTFHGFYPMKGKAGLQTRLSILMSDKLCFVSKYEQEWYQQRMRIADKKCHIVFNGIDFAKFALKDEGIRGLKDEGTVRLCMVGNFMTGRDHLTLMRALQLLKKRGINNFEFYFIGKKSESSPQIYDECVRICDENKMNHVHFLGARSDVPSLLKSMDGFIYSTNHDTFGIAVVEAMAVGLPVLVNDWPVMNEVCGEAVAYFKSKNAEDCANEIEKFLAELPQRKELAKQNAELVRKRFSIEAYIERLCNVYGE